VLELGCGTGSMLEHLQDSYQVSGLDTSSRMLSIARKKVSRAGLFRQNMVDFKINERFDVIFCVFDSINHVRRFSDWKKVFASSLGCIGIYRRVDASSLTSTHNGSSRGTSPSRPGYIGLEGTY